MVSARSGFCCDGNTGSRSKTMLLVLLLAVAMTSMTSYAAAKDAACFQLPVVILSPKTEAFPGNDCEQAPLPSKDCRKKKIAVQIEIVDHVRDDVVNCVADAPTSVYSSKMHYRGQSSLGFSKHQFDVKLKEDAEFLGFASDREFVLNGPTIDGSLIRNHLAQWLFRSTGRYSPHTRLMVMYIRDVKTRALSYQGIYLALEKISYGPNRVGLAQMNNMCQRSELNGGWAWQLNPLNYGVYSPNVVVDQYQLMFGPGARPVLMYPKAEAMTQTMRDYFVEPTTGPLPQLYRFLYENMTQTEQLDEYIDLGSFVDYLLHSELSQNSDAYRRSTYFFKDRDQPINAGPVWDFNLAYGMGMNQPRWLFAGHLLWSRLTVNYKFVALLAQRWRALRTGVWSDESIAKFVDNSTAPIHHQFLKCADWTAYVVPCANVNAVGSYHDQVNAVKKAVMGRAKWMDENVAKLYGKVDAGKWGQTGSIPTYNCGPDGTDSGCLTDPEKYINAVSFPPVRTPFAGEHCSSRGVTNLEKRSIDPCWMSAGVYFTDGSITNFCSGNGFCPQGPGATCKCIRGKSSPTCEGEIPIPDSVQMKVEPEHQSDRSIHLWDSAIILLAGMVCVGALIATIVSKRRRQRSIPFFSERRPILSFEATYGT